MPAKLTYGKGKLFTIVILMPNFSKFEALINVGKSF
jgi:hypothetical protein